jgi:hypothetical protein
MLSDAGSPLLSQAFDPYGNMYASTGTATSSFGYTGEQVDANGLGDLLQVIAAQPPA